MRTWCIKIALLVAVFLVVLSCGDSGTGSSSGSGPDIEAFTITSSAFKHNARLDDKYCNFSSNISLPFEWKYPPKDVQSFALVIHDPQGGDWIHWAVFNIPKNCTSIAEGASQTSNMPAGSVELKNEFSTAGYGGPQPPEGSGTHRYTVRLYALNVPSIAGLSTSVFKSYSDINTLLAGKIIKQVEIVGTYSR
jgi:Raf kinase inhibitor-like YbhB/YbcL family protein